LNNTSQGKNPGEKLDPWIGAVDNSSQPDVYVVGFQEIVALTGTQLIDAVLCTSVD
jgi:hypothetical protein